MILERRENEAVQGTIHGNIRRINGWEGQSFSEGLPRIGDDKVERVDEVRGTVICEVLRLKDPLVGNVRGCTVIKSKVSKIHVAVLPEHYHVSVVVINKIDSQEGASLNGPIKLSAIMLVFSDKDTPIVAIPVDKHDCVY